ncbi:hypothetical protein H5410_052827 [Solanum commersonii]|uniref:Uncharacterized protein n=1 Tax=Solanum commersonii TaxID=4109 RepID=A0A9J5X5A2_SOLCO|nr:hypothetical protein H5410_052827 [Solanum commersonii]
MAESFTLQTEVLASPVPPSEEVLVGSMVVSSTISERLFDGDLPEEKGPDSCILTAGAELVIVQSLASLRGDTQPILLDQELTSPDQVSHKSQYVFDQTLIPLGVEDDEEEEEEPQLRWRSRDSAEERNRKGKLVKTHLKGENKRYGMRMRPNSMILLGLWQNEKWKHEEERVKLKGTQKGQERTWSLGFKLKGKKKMMREERIAKMKHQKVLNGRVFDTDIVTKFGMTTLFDAVIIQEWSHLFEPPTPYLHEPEVREFFYKIKLLEDGGITTTVKDIDILLDEETLGIILGVLVKGVRTIEGCKPSGSSPSLPPSEEKLSVQGCPKSFLKGNISWCSSSLTKCSFLRLKTYSGICC